MSKPDPKLVEALAPFLTVTYVAVSVYGYPGPQYELRLYVPKRVHVDELPRLTEQAKEVYAHLEFAKLIQLECNRAGLCFNAFVPGPSLDLLAAVNAHRAKSLLRPLQIQ